MKIEGTPEEFAALVVAIQERQSDELVKSAMDTIASQLSSFRILES